MTLCASINLQELIESMNDKELHSLLEEAMNYKNPRDVTHKSETFKVSIINIYLFSLSLRNKY
jgi:hypothetical protein